MSDLNMSILLGVLGCRDSLAVARRGCRRPCRGLPGLARRGCQGACQSPVGVYFPTVMDKQQAGSPAKTGWLTRGEAARLLGVSVGKVRRAEGGLLHPVRGDDGAWYFEPGEVE